MFLKALYMYKVCVYMRLKPSPLCVPRTPLLYACVRRTTFSWPCVLRTVQQQKQHFRRFNLLKDDKNTVCSMHRHNHSCTH